MRKRIKRVLYYLFIYQKNDLNRNFKFDDVEFKRETPINRNSLTKKKIVEEEFVGRIKSQDDVILETKLKNLSEKYGDFGVVFNSL